MTDEARDLLLFNMAELQKRYDHLHAKVTGKPEFQCAFCTRDAWDRVVQQASEFSRKEAALGIRNNSLLRQVTELEQRIKSMTVLLEEKEKEDNVINLEDAVKNRRASGGGIGEWDGVDWLSPLDEHTIFLAKNKKDQSFVLTQYEVLYRGERARILKVLLNSWEGRPDEAVVIRVDPKSFCAQNMHFETLPRMNIPISREDDNDDSSGSD